jgi:hypothetical protein
MGSGDPIELEGVIASFPNAYESARPTIDVDALLDVRIVATEILGGREAWEWHHGSVTLIGTEPQEWPAEGRGARMWIS